MSSSDSIDHFIRSYGDMLFDLCQSVLGNSFQAQVAFRAILKKIKSGNRFQKYSSYERSWILRLACNRILSLGQRHGYQFSVLEQIKLDSSANIATRLKQFGLYFYRLPPEDQILLLLKDKYGIPYSEISTALATPEGALKIQRQQALRTLEEWLWTSK